MYLPISKIPEAFGILARKTTTMFSNIFAVEGHFRLYSESSFSNSRNVPEFLLFVVSSGMFSFDLKNQIDRGNSYIIEKYAQVKQWFTSRLM